MDSRAFRQIALMASIIAAITNLGAPAVLGLSWMGMSGPPIAIAATTVMILTLALQVAFVVLQIFPGGRTPIAIRMMGHDAWITIIVLTALPGVLWHYLAAIALPPMQLIMPGFITPLANVVLFVIARELYHRRSAKVRA